MPTSLKERSDGTVFVALPESMRRPIEGGCQCSFCKAHPLLIPSWDTIAAHPDAAYAWTIHYPELSR